MRVGGVEGPDVSIGEGCVLFSIAALGAVILDGMHSKREYRRYSRLAGLVSYFMVFSSMFEMHYRYSCLVESAPFRCRGVLDGRAVLLSSSFEVSFCTKIRVKISLFKNSWKENSKIQI